MGNNTFTRSGETEWQLKRRFFDFAFETKECKTTHIALFMWIVELNNRLGWKEEFGLPTHDTMEGLSIGNKATYHDALEYLETSGFISIVQKSKNQYQSCVIKICWFNSEPAQDTAVRSPLDIAMIQHGVKQSDGIDGGNVNSSVVATVPIDKHLTENHLTKKQERGTPPALGDVFSFFKKESNWDDQYCTAKAEKFIDTYIGDWKKSRSLNWEIKAKDWIVTERVTAQTASKNSKFPDHPDPKFADNLGNEERKQFFKHLENLGWSKSNGQWIRSGSQNRDGEDWMKQLSQKVGAEKIIIPPPSFPDATIPTDIKQS